MMNLFKKTPSADPELEIQPTSVSSETISEVKSLAPADPNSIEEEDEEKEGIGNKLGGFFQSLEEIMVDITTLEVSTMLVEQINGDKFIPWEIYRDIYPIDEDYLKGYGVHESLIPRYIDLRKKLELEYCLLLIDPTTKIAENGGIEETKAKKLSKLSIKERYPILTNTQQEWHLKQSLLPDPRDPSREDFARIQELLQNSHFFRLLRRIAELKSTLDNRNVLLLQNKGNANPSEVDSFEKQNFSATNEMIYAQTIIQLDGDILNRYAQDVFKHPKQELLLEIHRKSVIEGQEQWHKLLQFLVNLIATAVKPKEKTSPAKKPGKK